jgi:hypothetical protein
MYKIYIRRYTGMDDIKQKMIDFLLKYANPSIKLRVKDEILKDITIKEKQELQNQILSEKIVQFIAKKQLENGWIGLGFHGSNKNAGRYDNQEVGTKYLAEKGLHGTDVLNRAMNAFVTTELIDPCYRTGGRYISEFEVPAAGQNIVRCACIARAHYDDVINITPQIRVALESFKRVTEVDSIFDVSRPIKGRRLFNDKERWPCKYHLEMLAFSDIWKNDENIEMMAESFKRLMRTDRPEYMDIEISCWLGYICGPAGRFTEGFSQSKTMLLNRDISDGIRRSNLEKVEWLVRCGLYPHLSMLRDEVDFILNHINEDGVCEVGTFEIDFRGWGPYSGSQLEVDWKSKVKKQCDITFRALLILHYSFLDK